MVSALWLTNPQGLNSSPHRLKPEIIVLSDSSYDSKGPSILRVPVEGPSIQGLLDWYGYETIEEYLSDNYFPSTYKDNTDNDNFDEDTIQECYSAKSKGKYVPVSKKHNPKVKSPIPIKGCVLGIANVDTWEDILKKFGVRKQESCAYKAKGKKKGFRWRHKNSRDCILNHVVPKQGDYMPELIVTRNDLKSFSLSSGLLIHCHHSVLCLLEMLGLRTARQLRNPVKEFL
ncbi:hypothetical protein Tco_0590148 [Tanacetum coccineum]